MPSDVHARDKPVIGASEVAGSSWTPAFDQHVPARVSAAVSFADGFVVLSEEDGVPAEVASAVIARLREAGFETATTTAPLSDHSALSELIVEAVAARSAPERPLVVVVARAETLSAATVQRLVGLAGLRQRGQPVLRFLLMGTPALWPVLRGAGLGGLEHDAAAHVRLMPDVIRCLPASMQAEVGDLHEPGVGHIDVAAVVSMERRQTAPSPDALAGVPEILLPQSKDGRIGRPAALAIVGLTLAGIGLVGAGATWAILVPRPDRPAVSVPVTTPSVADPAPSPDARLSALLDRERQEVAADHSSSDDDLIETRRQIDEILPQVSNDAIRRLSARADGMSGKPADMLAPISGPTASAPEGSRQAMPAEPPPSAPMAPGSAASGSGASQPVDDPAGAPGADPLHVTLRYSRGDSAAAAAAARIRTVLRARGITVDGPLALGQVIERSSLAYYFTQDQVAALDLVQHLLPPATRVRRLPPPGGLSLPRPGEISIFIGSSDTADQPVPSGKQT